MVTDPKTLDADATVGEVRAALHNDHVHMVLLVASRTLRGTVVREDLGDAPDQAAALPISTLAGRTIAPQVPAQSAMRHMVSHQVRRLAVCADDGELLGLLCLKRRRDGFCSDQSVAQRTAVPGCVLT